MFIGADRVSTVHSQAQHPHCGVNHTMLERLQLVQAPIQPASHSPEARTMFSGHRAHAVW